MGSTVSSHNLLSENTRRLAERGLGGDFGRQLVYADPTLAIPESYQCGDRMRYALTVMRIAETAPLRIEPDSLILGASTYLEAPYHKTPISGESSTSHLPLGFPRILKMGYAGLRREVKHRLAKSDLNETGKDLLQSMLICLEAAGMWHSRYVDGLEQLISVSSGQQKAHYERVLRNVRDVPENPPKNFYQAVQSLWFMYGFHRLVGNWPGIGRIDMMLGPYLERDLSEGSLTLDKAREILAHFWISGTDWIGSRKHDSIDASGDAQHYQNIVLSGVDSKGFDVTNNVTYLVLDIVQELHISDFPIAVRVNANSPERLLRRIAEVQRRGGGIVSLYNDAVVIPGLVRLGIPLEEARDFANDGCWEVLIPGKTNFSYVPFDLLELLQNVLAIDGQLPVPEFEGFEKLYRAFVQAMAKKVKEIHETFDHAFDEGRAATLVSLFMEDCIKNARGYFDRGTRYIFRAPHAGGMADVCNCLLALKKVVYEESVVSLEQFVGILRDDWNGNEVLRERVRNHYTFYGNNEAESDAMMERVFNDYTDCVWETRFRNGIFRPAGISTFGREVPWMKHRLAGFHGFRKGDILATNFSPTPGTDRKGPTAVLKSYCHMDFERLPNGATLELKIHPSCVKGEEGINALMGLYRIFVELGGFYFNIDVIDSEVLKDAQEFPDRYPNLAVRVAGWCARFTTLHKKWQDMVIQRTQHYL